MKYSFKNKFSLDRKRAFSAGVSKKTYTKWFLLARKSVSTTRSKAFVEKYVSSTKKTASSGKKIKENGFHWQENVFILKLVPPNFNNDFQHQKKSS